MSTPQQSDRFVPVIDLSGRTDPTGRAAIAAAIGAARRRSGFGRSP